MVVNFTCGANNSEFLLEHNDRGDREKFSLPNTRGYLEFKTFYSTTVRLKKGKNSLKFVIGEDGANFDWFELQLKDQ